MRAAVTATFFFFGRRKKKGLDRSWVDCGERGSSFGEREGGGRGCGKAEP